MAIDTLKLAKRLREVGFSDPQAEALVETVQEAAQGAELAAKADVGGLRAELKADIAELRGELREVELRFEARLEAIKGDLLNRVFGMILGALVVNIVAIVGAMFGVAKLLGH
jgi:DNA-binding transcriptional MerR regulator